MTKQVLITGANRGIGLGLVSYFLEAGWNVTATCRNPDAATELANLAKDYPKHCEIETCDVASDLSVLALADKFGRDRPLDLLVNNAGMLLSREEAFKKFNLDDVVEVFKVNTVGAMRVTQALLNNLNVSRGKPTVAHITSQMGSIKDNTSGGYYSYRISKAGLNMFHKSFTVDFPKIISVTLHPGWVKTDMGGANAPTSVDESTRGLGDLMTRLSAKDSGKFLNFRGEEIPW